MKELDTFRKFLNENIGSFGDDKKIALQNSLTGLAKDMVEDGTLFDEYGNMTKNEENLKDGATPEQIKAIDQIKSAVDKMGGEVTYGEKDSDGELSYTYLVFGGDLKVITKEKDELEEGEEINEYMDIDEPGNPLYDLNNDDEAVKFLNGLMDKYGETVVQLWITSGEYPQDY